MEFMHRLIHLRIVSRMLGLTLLLISLFSTKGPLPSVFSGELLANSSPRSHPIEIHNRVLWSYRSSTITLLDVVHQLDHQLMRLGAEELITTQERYDFYQQNWAPVLRDMIDNELIYQDATDHGMPIGDGEAKDELVLIHGNEYLSRLDEINTSLPAALELVKKELLVQRMYYFRVVYPARSNVTPIKLARAYAEYVEKNPATTFWRYHVVTLRSTKEEALKEAQKLQALYEKGSTLEQLRALIPSKSSGEGVLPSTAFPQLTISEPFEQVSEQISKLYLQQLYLLEPGKISSPIDFSRNSQEGIYRLFLLERRENLEPESFAAMRPKLEQQIIEQGEQVERVKYLSTLRKRLELEQGESFMQIFRPSTPLFILR